MKVVAKLLIALAVLGLAGFAFVLGAWSYRQQEPPYTWFKSLLRTTGSIPLEAESVGLRAERSLDKLTTLGYLQAHYDANSQDKGVLVYDRSRAFNGYNFYNERERSIARLIDMEGNTLHEWKYSHVTGYWHHAELLPDGRVLVVMEGTGIACLDIDSNLEWFYKSRAHHALWVTETGDTYILSSKTEVRPEIHSSIPVRYDDVVALSSDGTEKEAFSLLESVENSSFSFIIPTINEMSGEGRTLSEIDLMHSNQIQVFDGSLASVSPLFRRGNLLVSIRNFNAVVIVDGETKKAIWAWGPNNLIRQHNAILQDNGHILIFDNGSQASRALELNILTRKIDWLYEDGENFFSSWGGACQRLRNGNTLITNTETGYVFEVTPAGEKVWEFANPEVNEDGERTNIWRTTRFAPGDLDFIN